MRERWRPYFRCLAAALGLLVLTGCPTIPKPPRNSGLLYLYYAMEGNRTEMARHARAVADESIGLLKLQAPDDESMSLPRWQQYASRLGSPLVIQESAYRGADRGRVQIRKYVASHPELLRLDGPGLSTRWSQELGRARGRVRDLTSSLAAHRSKAKEALSANDYGIALSALSAALKISPEDPGTRAQFAEVKASWSKNRERDLADAQKQVRQLTEYIRTRFGGKEMDAKRARQTAQQLASVQARVDGITLEIKQLGNQYPKMESSAPVQEMLAETEKLHEALVRLRGESWSETIRLATVAKAYWNGYNSVQDMVGQKAKTKSEADKQVLTAALRSAYASMLQNGIDDLISWANENYDRDRFGAALTFCYIAEELFDYGVAEDLHRGVLPSKIKETRRDAIKKLESRLKRRLIIQDFQAGMGIETRDLVASLRAACRPYGLSNDVAWALEVIEDSSLSSEYARERKPEDYVFLGAVRDLAVHRNLPHTEIHREIESVGSGNIQKIPDPLYKITQSESKTIYSQEVYLFQCVVNRFRTEASLDIELRYARGGGTPAQVCRLKQAFPSQDVALSGIVFESDEKRYDSPFLGTPRLGYATTALRKDPWPMAVPERRSPADEVRRALLLWARQALSEAIENTVALYPMEDLIRPGLAYEAKGRRVEAAEKWGECLLYCHKISRCLPEGTKPAQTGWLYERKIMAARIEQWCRSRWKDQPAEVKTAAGDIWKRAVAAAFAAADTKP